MNPAAVIFESWWKRGPTIAAYKTAQEQLKIVADVLVNRMKATAPVYKGPELVEVGALRDSIHTEPGKDAFHIKVVAGGPSTTHNGYDYSRAVEFGTQTMAAEPFFWPTYRTLRDEIKAEMKRKIGKSIEEYSAKT